MKTVKIMLPLLAALMFGNGVVRAQNEAKHDKPAVEVVVFHGVKQCQTCQAIKKNSQEVAEELAADGKNVTMPVIRKRSVTFPSSPSKMHGRIPKSSASSWPKISGSC